MVNIYLSIIINFCLSIENFFPISLISKLHSEKIISETVTGIIFSSFYFGNLLIIPVKRFLLFKIKKNNLLTVSVLIHSFSNLLFIYILYYIINFKKYIYLLCIFRCLQGISNSLSNTILYSTLIIKSKKKKLKLNIGLMELFYILGNIISPIFGSYLFIKNKIFLFVIISLFKLFFLMFICKKDMKENELNKISFFNLFSKSRIFLNCLVIIIQKSSINFFFPLILKHLNQFYNYNLLKSSIFFSIEVISFYLSLPFIKKLISCFGTKLIILLSLFINYFFINFIYPANIFPHSVIIIIIGLILIGFSESLITIGSIEDLIGFLIYNMKFNVNLSNDNASGLYYICDNLGKSIGPIIGGYYSQKSNFEYCCFFMSILNIVGFFIFILFSLNMIKHQLISINKGNIKKFHNNNVQNFDKNIETDGLFQFNSENESFDFFPFINVKSKELYECLFIRTSTFYYGGSVSTLISNL